MTNKNKKAVICENQAELSYMNEWLKLNGKSEAWLGERKSFPICITTDGCWLDSLDRAIGYISFKDFVSQ